MRIRLSFAELLYGLIFLFLLGLIVSPIQATDMPEERIGASSDDAHETTGGSVNITLIYLDLDASSSWGGLRFITVPLPQGATITTATIGLYFYTTSHDSPKFDIFAEDTADATTFTTDNYNISGRTETSASVTWSENNVGTGWKTSPDIKTVVQEIVDRPDWSENNDLAFLLDLNPGCDAWPFTYDQSSTYVAKFNCSYTIEEAEEYPARLIYHEGSIWKFYESKIGRIYY